jgi:hypothetical protein
MKASSIIPNMLTKISRNDIIPFLERLKKNYSAMDQKYLETADYYGFNCKGCEDNCCLTRFYHHTIVEYFFIKEGFFRLDEKKQVEVKQRSLAVCRKADEADKKGTPVQQMCPVNAEGLCILYPYRPMICRLHGIPHELQSPDQNILTSPGCGTFTLKCEGKKHFRLNRTPFYVQMAALEKEMKQATGITQKIKMTVAQMIVTFEDG